MKRLKLAFYGDDFTGSTDALEALALAGWRTVLFLQPPSPDDLKDFDHMDAIGVAGNSRSWDPQRMRSSLLPAFRQIKELDPEIVHYKVCSTFDSSPTIGSIGCALDFGRETFGARLVPVLAAAPVLGRYCSFGNLFARSGLDSPVYRLDRHPTMSRHPVTPMAEADLTRHLSRQTSAPCHLFDLTEVDRPDVEDRFLERLEAEEGALMIDMVADRQLEIVGRLLRLAAARSSPLFVIGSSGVEYALTTGGSAVAAAKPKPGPAKQMLVVSGSCSPVSDRQMAWAVANGYCEIPLNPSGLLTNPDSTRMRTTARVMELLERGANVLVNTCRGPEDPRLAEGAACLRGEGGERIGEHLASILGEVLAQRKVPRTMVIGGDTSAYVGARLGIRYLEFVASIEPGGPLCRAVGEGPADGASIVFKGGQVGKVDYLGKAQGLF